MPIHQSSYIHNHISYSFFSHYPWSWSCLRTHPMHMAFLHSSPSFKPINHTHFPCPLHPFPSLSHGHALPCMAASFSYHSPHSRCSLLHIHYHAHLGCWRTWSLVPREASLTPSMVVLASGSSLGVVDPRLIWPKVVACSLSEVEMVVGSISVGRRATINTRVLVL